LIPNFLEGILAKVNFVVNFNLVKMKKITFYRSRSGQCPVEEFLISLSPKARQKVAFVLKIIRELERAPIQYFKKLRNTIKVSGKFASNLPATFIVFSDFLNTII